MAKEPNVVTVNRKSKKRTLAVRTMHEREQRGWTKVDLAWYAGLSPTTISRLEAQKGTRLPMAETALRIAMALGKGVTVDWLLDYRVAKKRAKETVGV